MLFSVVQPGLSRQQPRGDYWKRKRYMIGPLPPIGDTRGPHQSSVSYS